MASKAIRAYRARLEDAYQARARAHLTAWRWPLTRHQRRLIHQALGTRCDICGEEKQRLHLDHDHATLKTRGQLCTKCNFGLGFFRDDRVLLRNAIEYLQQPPVGRLRPSTSGLVRIGKRPRDGTPKDAKTAQVLDEVTPIVRDTALLFARIKQLPDPSRAIPARSDAERL